MSNGNSTGLKQPKNDKHLDLCEDELSGNDGNSQDKGPGLDLDLDFGLNLGLNSHPRFNYARCANLMPQPHGGNGFEFEKNNSSINAIKTINTDRYLPRSHPTDGGDDDMPHLGQGRLGRKRSRSTVAEIATARDRNESWAEDGQLLGIRRTQNYPDVDKILKIPIVDLVSNNGMNKNSSWTNNPPRFKSPITTEGTWHPEPEEEPDAPVSRVGRLVGVGPSTPARMRPRSEPPRLRLPHNLNRDDGENDLPEPLAWTFQVPMETSQIVERGSSRPSHDTSLPGDGGRWAGNIYERKKRKSSPKDKKTKKKDTKPKLTGNELGPGGRGGPNSSKAAENTDSRELSSGDKPCHQGYSPPARDKVSFKRTARTFPEIRAGHPFKDLENVPKIHEVEAAHRDASKENEKPPFKGYSPTSSKDKSPFKRSSNSKPKKYEILSPSFSPDLQSSSSKQGVKGRGTNPSPTSNTSKLKQSSSNKRYNKDVGLTNADSVTTSYPNYSPSSYNSVKNQSKSASKSPEFPRGEKKSTSKKNSPNKRSKSPNRGRAKSEAKKRSCANPCGRSRTTSPSSSQTPCPPTYKAPCESQSKSSSNMPFEPLISALEAQRAIVNSTSASHPKSPLSSRSKSPQPARSKSPQSSRSKSQQRSHSKSPISKRSPSLTKNRSKTSLKSGSSGTRRVPSWGSLAETTMPLQPSFLPSFYEDFRTSPPSSRMNLSTWQNDYHSTEPPSARGAYSSTSVARSTNDAPRGSISDNVKAKKGSHKNGKKSRKSKRDKNENKHSKSSGERKKSFKSSAGDEADGASKWTEPEERAKCVPLYPPCASSSKESKQDEVKSKSPTEQVTPKKDQSVSSNKSGKTRLGVLCKRCMEFSPKGKLAVKWPSSCRRRCGQSMPRLGMISQLGEAFGSQLRSIANGCRHQFPGITPLYVSDAGAQEWFHYPEAQDDRGSTSTRRSSSRRESSEAKGSQMGASNDSAALVPANDGGSEVADETDAAGEPQTAESSDDRVSKRGVVESQESEAQCYRMRATVRNSKDVVRVDLEECSGVMCRSKKAFHDQPRSRVGRRRGSSKGRDGTSFSARHDGGGGGGGAGSRRTTSGGRSHDTSKSGTSRKRSGEDRSSKQSPRQQSPAPQERDEDVELTDSEPTKHQRKRQAASSSPDDVSSGREERLSAKKKHDRSKDSDKQSTRRIAETKSIKRSSGKNRQAPTPTDASEAYSTTKEDANDLSQEDVPGRGGKREKITVSSNQRHDDGKVKVKCLSSDSEQDCRLVSRCRRKRQRGATKGHHEDTISEDEMECSEYICGERSLVKVCTGTPRRHKRGHDRHVEEDSSAMDNSANHSSSNAQTHHKHRRSPARLRRQRWESQKSPKHQFSSSQLSLESLSMDSRRESCHRSPSDSLVRQRSSCYIKAIEGEGAGVDASQSKHEHSIGSSPVDPVIPATKRSSRNSPRYTGSRPSVGDQKSAAAIENLSSIPAVVPASGSNMTPSYLPDSDRHDEPVNSYASRSDLDRQPAKINGRMKFLSVNGGATCGDSKYSSSRSTAVGIQNGTVKMIASPKEMKIIRCDTDELDRSAGEGIFASLRSSIDSIAALQDEDFFISRPNPDPDSIARYERDSQYIKMRQRRLEKLEKSLHACDPNSDGFAPKSQYLNRVSRRKRSQARALSSDGDCDATSSCFKSPSCGDDDGTSVPARQSRGQAHRYMSQSKVKHPELLDQFSRIITPEQAIRLAETRNVISTDSDASGLVTAAIHCQRNISQNHDGGGIHFMEQLIRTNAHPWASDAAQKSSIYHTTESEGDNLCISDDRFQTPPSVNHEGNFKSHRRRQLTKHKLGIISRPILSHHYQTNEGSVKSSTHGVVNLEKEEYSMENRANNNADVSDHPGRTIHGHVRDFLEPCCDAVNESSKACYVFGSCVSKIRSEPQRNNTLKDRDQVEQNQWSRSHYSITCDRSDHSQGRKSKIRNDSTLNVYSIECPAKEVELSPKATIVSTANNIFSTWCSFLGEGEEFVKPKALRLGFDSDNQPGIIESGSGEEIADPCVSRHSLMQSRNAQEEHQDMNQSSNTDGDSNSYAAGTGVSAEHTYQAGAIDTLRLLDEEDSNPPALETSEPETVESLSSCDVGPAQCSPTLPQFTHLGVPLRRTHSSRLAASIPKPKKYFADSESEWSISSDDDHLIQMAKSLPAIFHRRSAGDRVFENIRRNSMRALVYAASISSHSSHKKLRSTEQEGDGPNRLKHAIHKVGQRLRGKPNLQNRLYNELENPFHFDQRSSNNNHTAGSLSSGSECAGVAVANHSESQYLTPELGRAVDRSHSSQKEAADSATSCNLLSYPPSQLQKTLANACKQISSVLKASRESSVDPSHTEPILSCGSPAVKKSEGDSHHRLPSAACIQSVPGPNSSDLIKLRTEDGEEFWILSAEAIKNLNVLPQATSAPTCEPKLKGCCQNETKDPKNNLKHSSGPAHIVSTDGSSDKGQERQSSGTESSPPVFDEELHGDRNQSKHIAADSAQVSARGLSGTFNVEANSKRRKNACCSEGEAESCDLLSASQPCYFMNYDDFLRITNAENATSNHQPEESADVERKVGLEDIEVKQNAATSDTDIKLPKNKKQSQKKRKNYESGSNVNASHIARTESSSDPVHTERICAEIAKSDRSLHSNEPKSSCVDPSVFIVKKKRKRRRGYSSVDPPSCDKESSCFTEVTSSESRRREISPTEMRDRGDRIGTDLDVAIYNHMKAYCDAGVYPRPWDSRDLYGGGVFGKEGGDTRQEPSQEDVKARPGKAHSSASRDPKSISKSSKSTQANDTLSLVSSTTLTSEGESESVTDSIFDKPSVVVVSLSGKGKEPTVRATDNAMPKEHKSILLDWLKTIVPRSLLSSTADREDESSSAEQMVRRKRGSSEPRKSRKGWSRRGRRALSVGPSDGLHDNSSNALTTTDFSWDDTSPRSYLNRNSSQSGDVCDDRRNNRKRRKRGTSQTVTDKELPPSPNSDFTSSIAWQSVDPLGNKNRSKSSQKHRRDPSIENLGSKEKSSGIKTSGTQEVVKKRKEKSHKEREACAHCGNTDFTRSQAKVSCVDPQSFASGEGDVCMSNSIGAQKSSSSETSTFISCEEHNLSALRERFDRLVADLDNVYKRREDAQPQGSLEPSFGPFLETPVTDSFGNIGSMHNLAAAAERETSAPTNRRRDSKISFGSDFLRDYRFDTLPEPLSREEDLLRQYSHGLPERRFSGYGNMSVPLMPTLSRPDFGGGFRYRRNSLLGDFRSQSFRGPSSDPILDVYSGGRFSGVNLSSRMDESNNKSLPERDIVRRLYFGDRSGNVFGETSTAENNGCGTYREVLTSNWNESANNGRDDDDSSSKSSTDEDFLEFEVEASGASGATGPHSGVSTGGDTSHNIFSSLVKEQMADVRSSNLATTAIPRDHLLNLLSKTPGLIPDSQCLCPGCGCRSNNYQSSRKQDLLSRLPSMAARNINGSGNLTGKEPYPEAVACGGLSMGGDLPKDNAGGNNRASDEEFVSAIEHLSSAVRNCHTLMPRHMWQECQEVDDTCNHRMDSSFYMGDGPAGFGRLAREDCLMHLDEDHAGVNKFYRGQHCGPDGILPEIGSKHLNRGPPWQPGVAASNAGPVMCQTADAHSQFFNNSTQMCRGQGGRPQRKLMTQWYEDGSGLTKSLEALSQSRVPQRTNCTLSEHILSKVVHGKESACGHSSMDCGVQIGRCTAHEDIDDEDDEEEEDDDDQGDFEEAVEEEEEDEDVGESEEEEEEEEEDDDVDDNLEEANEDENHNKDVTRQRLPRELCMRDGVQDNGHAMKEFPDAGKQAGDMAVESKVATITNGRFTAGDTAASQERAGDEGIADLKPSSDNTRSSLKQRKFSFDQIKVPAIEKERVRFACDESGDWAEIGRGSYGCVYLGLLDASIEVAIKDFYEASSWELVIHEARMLMFLQDTGITPRLYGLRRRFDVSKQPSEYCIIMEYFGDGRTLFNVMSDKIPLRTDEWLDIVGQLVAGLRLIHRKGVLINDLKADNILVDLTKGRKVIRYIDVGMATYRQGLTFQLPEDQMNRYNFLAPEVREGGRTTTRSDIYSLGYMLEQMCRLADSALGGLRKLVSRCMDKRANKRPDLDDIVSQVHRFIGAKASRSAANSSSKEHPLLNNSV